ncbi:MAG: hypothetical protein HYZ16_07905 [Bacteroidetes bacterium]|jgi:regulator of replication initiation timing|nr:hypothetical protein [Bacteroidota bacterium]
MEPYQTLTEIERKVGLLAQSFNRLKNDNNRLRAEIEVLRNRVAQQDTLIGELENKNVHLHIAKTGGQSPGQGDAIKKKIDQYIKEIDKCIELLNS